ncbi:BOI-related E3 ubiquitin-protein ligase 1-like [Prosopis cineraria]|uniref:BOI-related E3 ubiquitin-protein ligase 1-like n=1 Tax=Prosopis cineraria TaxID=364024 RepID=UPI00240F668A|nr:BOI-related E3 ubiquitin-protein ligase 1-like [Prosopis cineraria]
MTTYSLRQSKALISGIQEAMTKKLIEKDEKIQRMGKMNWVLQKRVKSLCVENQIWRELAQTDEATANSMRSNLEQVLAHVGEDSHDGGRPAPRQTTPSQAAEAPTRKDSAQCGWCGDNVGRKDVCVSTVRNCPVCHSSMNANVHVNFSQGWTLDMELEVYKAKGGCFAWTASTNMSPHERKRKKSGVEGRGRKPGSDSHRMVIN